jgi:hypothetical protein
VVSCDVVWCGAVYCGCGVLWMVSWRVVCWRVQLEVAWTMADERFTTQEARSACQENSRMREWAKGNGGGGAGPLTLGACAVRSVVTCVICIPSWCVASV